MASEREERSEKIIPHSRKYDNEPPLEYKQFLSIILVVGFLIIGSTAGLYLVLKELMGAPCLGCLGLYPNVDLEFGFDTVENREHPDFILEALKDGPVFIEFTQNDENCPPCARMRPYIEDLEEDYNENVVFYIININEKEITKMFKNDKDINSISDSEAHEIFKVYDRGNIVGGGMATPTFIILTYDQDENGNIRPSFAVAYGEFVEESAKKTDERLQESLDYSLALHHHYLEMYLADH